MERSNDVEAKVLLELPEVSLHRLILRQKNQFSQGTLRLCQLEKPNKERVHFLNMNSFYYTLTKETIFVKVVYKRNVSYVYPHFDSGLCAFTVALTEAKITQLDEILTQEGIQRSNVATMVNIDQAMENPLLRDKIATHYPGLRTDEIVITDQLQHVIDVGGKYAETGLKWLGGLISGGVERIGGYIEKKVQHTGQTSNSQQAQTKWNELKEGTSKLFQVSSEYVSAVLNPVINKGREVVGQIGEKIDNSDNSSIKYLKEVGGTAAEAARHAFNGVAQAASEVGGAVTKTTKELWEKKYGGQQPPADNTEHVGSAPGGQPAPQVPPTNPPVEKKDSVEIKEDIEIEKEPLLQKISEQLNKPVETQPNAADPKQMSHTDAKQP